MQPALDACQRESTHHKKNKIRTYVLCCCSYSYTWMRDIHIRVLFTFYTSYFLRYISLLLLLIQVDVAPNFFRHLHSISNLAGVNRPETDEKIPTTSLFLKMEQSKQEGSANTTPGAKIRRNSQQRGVTRAQRTHPRPPGVLERLPAGSAQQGTPGRAGLTKVVLTILSAAE